MSLTNSTEICTQDRLVCVSYSDKHSDNYPSVCTVCLCLHKTCRTHMHMHTQRTRELSSSCLHLHLLFTPSASVSTRTLMMIMCLCVCVCAHILARRGQLLLELNCWQVLVSYSLSSFGSWTCFSLRLSLRLLHTHSQKHSHPHLLLVTLCLWPFLCLCLLSATPPPSRLFQSFSTCSYALIHWSWLIFL